MRGGKRKCGHWRHTDYVANFADWVDYKIFTVEKQKKNCEKECY